MRLVNHLIVTDILCGICLYNDVLHYLFSFVLYICIVFLELLNLF